MPDRKKSIQSVCLMLVLMLLISIVPLTGFDIARRITVKFDGKTKVVNTNLDTPQEIIKLAGTDLRPGDGYNVLGHNPRLQDGSVIEVLRCKTFTLHRNNEVKRYTSHKQTVGEALSSIGVVTEHKLVHPATKSSLEDNMHIYVIKPGEQFTYTEVVTEAPIEYHDDVNMAYGKEEVLFEGKTGLATVVSKSYRNEDGGYNMIELSRKEKLKPQKRIVKRGADMAINTPNGLKRYSKKIRCEATAYTHTGERTCTGIMPYRGVVAVDPRYIPLGTKMYIPGYGMGLAADTGGAIKGHIIDIFVDSESEAYRWGRRNVDVYILRD